MLVYGECECFVMQMFYVCVLCASCGSSQCCVLHDLHFVRKTVEETVWRDVLTTICRSEDLTVPPLVGCCCWNHTINPIPHRTSFNWDRYSKEIEDKLSKRRLPSKRRKDLAYHLSESSISTYTLWTTPY